MLLSLLSSPGDTDSEGPVMDSPQSERMLSTHGSLCSEVDSEATVVASVVIGADVVIGAVVIEFVVAAVLEVVAAVLEVVGLVTSSAISSGVRGVRASPEAQHSTDRHELWDDSSFLVLMHSPEKKLHSFAESRSACHRKCLYVKYSAPSVLASL